MKKIDLSYLKSLSLSSFFKSLSSGSFSLKSIQLPINLQRRERIIVTVAGVVVLVLIVLRLTLFPVIDRRDRLHNQIRTQQEALGQMHELKREHDALTRFTRNMERQLKQRPENFTLFSFTDRLASQSGLKQNIVYMKPSTSNLKNSPYALSMVELKLTSLTMLQLTTFLHGIEDPSKIVWVKRLSVTKEDKNEGLINAVVQVETMQQ
jgi:general secretion pathway protein M